MDKFHNDEWDRSPDTFWMDNGQDSHKDWKGDDWSKGNDWSKSGDQVFGHSISQDDQGLSGYDHKDQDMDFSGYDHKDQKDSGMQDDRQTHFGSQLPKQGGHLSLFLNWDEGEQQESISPGMKNQELPFPKQGIKKDLYVSHPLKAGNGQWGSVSDKKPEDKLWHETDNSTIPSQAPIPSQSTSQTMPLEGQVSGSLENAPDTNTGSSEAQGVDSSESAASGESASGVAPHTGPVEISPTDTQATAVPP